MAVRPSTRPPSLRPRLAATALMVTTLTSAVLVVGIAVLLSRITDSNIRSHLDAKASAAAATVREGPSGVRVLEQPSLVLDQNVWVFDATGTLVDGRDPTNPRVARVVQQLSSATHTEHTTVDEVSFAARPVRRDGQQIATVVAAEDHDPYERGMRASLWLSIALAAATIAIATTAAWLAAAKSLRQVQAMADLADDWSEHDADARFDPGPGGDEIAQLGRTLDRMLDRIVDALAAERRLTDEIAHELRTPLAVVLAESDLARATARPEDREALENIRDSALRMRDSIDTMLAVARAHAGSDDRATVGSLLASLGLDPTPYDEVLLTAPVPPLAAAVRPLLENAERHGSGPPRVEVTRSGRTIVIAVVDDGPGVAADELENVFEPGHTTSPDGSGLGLALGRRMARAAGGDLVACAGPGGRFELRVPSR
jgi:two-component system, OmpR family, sensor kinase